MCSRARDTGWDDHFSSERFLSPSRAVQSFIHYTFLFAVCSRDLYLNGTRHCLIRNCGNQICLVSCLCAFPDSSSIARVYSNRTSSRGSLCATWRSRLVWLMFSLILDSKCDDFPLPPPGHMFPGQHLAAGVQNPAESSANGPVLTDRFEISAWRCI